MSELHKCQMYVNCEEIMIIAPVANAKIIHMRRRMRPRRTGGAESGTIIYLYLVTAVRKGAARGAATKGAATKGAATKGAATKGAAEGTSKDVAQRFARALLSALLNALLDRATL